MTPKQRNATISKIAADVLDIETLETRNADHLDFHLVSVWGLRRALKRAFDAGQFWAPTTNREEKPTC